MDENPKKTPSDEEDDLETLRLVALKSLKKPPPASTSFSQSAKISNTTLPQMPTSKANYNFRSATRNYGNYHYPRGRFYKGRDTTNDHSVIYSNLISLTPRDSFEYPASNQGKIGSVFVPQDRHNSKSEPEEKGDEASSKFDRYRDTDKSEDEDSEEEALKIDSDDEPGKLDRADSLEALMQELDDEIQGIAKSKETDEKFAVANPESEGNKDFSKNESEEGTDTAPKPEELTTSDKKLMDKEDSQVPEPTDKPITINSNKAADRTPNAEPQLKKRRYHFSFQRGFRGSRGRLRDYKPTPQLFNLQYLPQNGALHHFPPAIPPVFSNPQFGPPPIIVNPSPFFDRPLPSLLIDTTQNLQNQARAPLSPRSAAFVLQNRAIIEKRKRSPRRSYSRSPSPRNRSRSISPRISVASPRKRSLSPRKRSSSPRRRSTSPLRNRSPQHLRKLSPLLLRKRSPSPLRKRSRSPRRRSMTPKRRSTSPKRRAFSPKVRVLSPKSRPFSPKRRSQSPRKRSTSPRKREIKDPENGAKNKLNIRDRLGFKSSSRPEEKANMDKPTPDGNLQKEVKILDPILEARKKKFESNEIKVREGVIRLKPKDELRLEEKIEVDVVKVESPKEVQQAVEHVQTLKKFEDIKELIDIETLNEEALLQDDALELDAHLDLFSEEESDNENEGRFKAKEVSGETSGTLPISKVMNGEKKEQKPREMKDPKKRSSKTQSRDLDNGSSGLHKRHERDSLPIDSTRRSRTRQSPKSDKPITSRKLGVKSERHPKKFDRKIEIKIKNPSKYERVDKIGEAKEAKSEKPRKLRKVDVKQETSDDDHEIIMEDDAESGKSITEEGDLRAQLSKKRAQKLNKQISHKGVTSRLLQNALENALPIKKHKKSKSKELSSSDGKLPIHLRLGLACGPDTFTKSKRKSKKRKSGEPEQEV